MRHFDADPPDRQGTGQRRPATTPPDAGSSRHRGQPWGFTGPRQRWEYEDDARITDLASAYGFGLVRGHPYVDGNKRVGLIAMVAFLDRNGLELTATNAEAISVILSLAAGSMSKAELGDWLERHCRPL